jgi:hypothetical protein
LIEEQNALMLEALKRFVKENRLKDYESHTEARKIINQVSGEQI